MINSIGTEVEKVLRSLDQDKPTIPPTPAAEDSELEKRERNDAFHDLCSDRGSRYARCNWKNYSVTCDEQQKALDAAKDFADKIPEHTEAGRSLIFFGPKGTGKDHLLMCCMATAILRHGFRYDRTGGLYANSLRSLFWINGADIYAEFRDLITRNRTDEMFLHKLTSPMILCISDPLPPSGTLTEYQQSQLFRVLDERYSRMLPTWITCNVSGGEEFDARIGPQNADRLRDGAICIHCNWVSYRKSQDDSEQGQ